MALCSSVLIQNTQIIFSGRDAEKLLERRENNRGNIQLMTSLLIPFPSTAVEFLFTQTAFPYQIVVALHKNNIDFSNAFSRDSKLP